MEVKLFLLLKNFDRLLISAVKLLKQKETENNWQQFEKALKEIHNLVPKLDHNSITKCARELQDGITCSVI